MTNDSGKEEEVSDVSGWKASEEEWIAVIEQVERAIIKSVANKVLENAGLKVEKVVESRRKVRLIELKPNYCRKQIVS